MSGEDFIRGMKHVGYGLCWLGFWIGLGLFNFQGKGCAEHSTEVEIARETLKEIGEL